MKSLSALHNLSPLAKLSLFVVLILTAAIFVTISFSLRQQQLLSKAWLTSQSAESKCNQSGEVELAVKFSNTEPVDSSLAMDVVAKDVQTGLTVDMGTVAPSKTGEGLVQTHKKQIDGSSVIFFLSWTNGNQGTDQRVAAYTKVSCEATPTATVAPTVKPTVAPTVKPTVAQPTSVLTPALTLVPTTVSIVATGADSTYFELDVVFDGIGAGGDSTNPNGKGNQNPLHKVRTVTLEVANGKNELVLSKSGEVTYASESGHFSGIIDMGTTLKDGGYIIKVKGSQYLRVALPGIVSVQAGKTNVLSGVDLVTGDINNDNVINILDYNLLMGCYSDLNKAASCDSGTSMAADLTDDGSINQFDYNLFLRELTTSIGK